MGQFTLSLVVVALLLTTVHTYKGVDVSALLSQSVWECIKKDGYSFACIRGYHSYGAVDVNAAANLKNAKAAGFITDLYLFPCKSKNAASQVNQMMNAIPSNQYGMIWLDVQTNPSTGCGWSTDHNSNCAYVKELASAVKAKGKKVGIYASVYMWTTIFGSKTACTDVSSEPLWYAHYDNNPTFADFAPFGGWTKPSIKQYKGSTAICGATVDFNYYP